MSPKREKKRGRPVLLVSLCGVLAAILYLRCDDGLGLLERVGLVDPEEPPSATIDAAPPAVDDARIERCRLRLDGAGLTLGGEPVELDDAVEACRAAGAADLVVTGDATFGTFEEVRAALEEAGVEVYQR
jgi:hypothetical protein